ncbi:MAG: nucleoside-triphosphatase [Candidatus Eisenbacteria bacterium]
MSGAAPQPVLLLTGLPGVGKTTVIRRVAAALSGAKIRGFVTEEIRENERRVGFRLESFDGSRTVLSHVRFGSRRRVGRYGVDIEALDAVVDRALRIDPDAGIYLIDEIGKMECLSERFVAAMRGLFESDRVIVATIARKGGGFIDEAKGGAGALLWEITAANREGMPERVLAWIRSARPLGGDVQSLDT